MEPAALAYVILVSVVLGWFLGVATSHGKINRACAIAVKAEAAAADANENAVFFAAECDRLLTLVTALENPFTDTNLEGANL